MELENNCFGYRKSDSTTKSFTNICKEKLKLNCPVLVQLKAQEDQLDHSSTAHTTGAFTLTQQLHQCYNDDNLTDRKLGAVIHPTHRWMTKDKSISKEKVQFCSVDSFLGILKTAH